MLQYLRSGNTKATLESLIVSVFLFYVFFDTKSTIDIYYKKIKNKSTIAVC